MTDRELTREVLMALGGIVEGNGSIALLNQEAAIDGIILRLEEIKREVSNKRRVAHAQETRERRIKPGDPQYGVHMRHCYGLDYDSVWGNETPTERHTCKYGENDICPAALFEDPWKEYCRADDAGEL